MFHWSQQPTEKEMIRNRIVIGWVLIFGGLFLAYLGFGNGAHYTVFIGAMLRAADLKDSLGTNIQYYLLCGWFFQPIGLLNADRLSPMISNLLISFLLLWWPRIDYLRVKQLGENIISEKLTG